jgi:hypothetical protein
VAVTDLNSFEGGSSGTTITAGNSGGASGTAFTSVTGTCTFDNAQVMHGGLAAKFVTSASTAFVQWNSIGNVTTLWFRLYCYLTANPAASVRVCSFQTSAATRCGTLSISTAGKLLFVDSAGTTQLTSTNSVNLNGWTRVEGFITGSATVGQEEFRLFLTPDSGIATETLTSAASLNTSGTLDQAVFGQNASASVTYWLDDIGVTDQGYLGPAAVPVQVFPHIGGPVWRRRFRRRQILPAVVPAAVSLIALPESGAADDSGFAVTAAVPLADAGTGADTLAVTAAVPLADAGTGTDTLAAGVAVALADAGTGADTLTVAAAVPAAESGAGADTLAITAAVPLADAGTGATTITVTAAVPLAETGSGADTLAIQAATNIALAETGTAADTIVLTAVTTANADLGAAADTLAVTVLLSLADAGSASTSLSSFAGAPAALKATSTPLVTARATSSPAAADPRDGTAAVTPLIASIYTATYTGTYTGGQVQSAPAVTDPRDGTATVTAAATSTPAVG